VRGRQVSQDVTADAGFLCGKAAMFGDTIKGTANKWEIGVCMREKKEKCVLHYNWNVWKEDWRDLGEASVGVRGQCYCAASCADLRQNKLHHLKQQSVFEKFWPLIRENSLTNWKRLTQISPPTTCTNFYSYSTQLLHVSAIYSGHL